MKEEHIERIFNSAMAAGELDSRGIKWDSVIRRWLKVTTWRGTIEKELCPHSYFMLGEYEVACFTECMTHLRINSNPIPWDSAMLTDESREVVYSK